MEHRVDTGQVQQRVGDVVQQKPVPRAVTQQGLGRRCTGGPIIDTDHLDTVVEHALTEMTAEEACSPGDHDALQFMHAGSPFALGGRPAGERT